MSPLVMLLVPMLLSSPFQESVRTFALDDVPAQFSDAVKRADAAAQTLQRRLSGRLMEAMKQSGPAGAVTVCRDEAARLTEEAARDSGAVAGRTSDRLRNPKNVAPSWAAAYVAATAGKPASEVRPAVFDLRDRVGVLRPITVSQPCTRCHGGPEAIPPEVSKILHGSYPDDRAIGYAEGDHRGFVWVVVPR